MKNHLPLTLLFIAFLHIASTQNVFTLNITYGENEEVNRLLYGNHFASLFDRCRCYDPWDPEAPVDSIEQCMEYIASIKSKVIRYPAGGDNKWMHPMNDTVGYGLLRSDLDTLLARDLIDSNTYLVRVAEVYSAIDNNPDGARYIDRLIDLVAYCDSINGFAPKVILVANVTMSRWMPDIYNVWDETLSAVRYLLDNSVVIGGIEMGNEHYDDGDLFPTFDDYWDHIFPLLDSLANDPELNQIPISLTAAPEPDAAEVYGYTSAKVDRFKDWNADLRRYADSTEVTELFDAYTVHIYQTPIMLEECYEQYEVDYYDLSPSYIIPFFPLPDTNLIESFQCAIDSFENFAENWLQYIFTHYTMVDDSTYRLGTIKKYWITEWGQKPATEKVAGEPGDMYGNFNNTFAEAAYTMEFLLQLIELVGAGSSPLDIQYATKHNTLSGFSYGLISYISRLDMDDDGSYFIKRASYYPFIINENIFSNAYKRVNCQAVPITGSYLPYIRGYFNYSNDLFYMPFVNSSNDEVYFDIHNMTGDTTALGGGSLTPSSSYGSIVKYIEADQLYTHAGDNQYMRDNAYYDTIQVAPLIDTIYTVTVSTSSPDTLIVLPPYSLGWVKWQVSPLPERESTSEQEMLISVWPNPASEVVFINCNYLPDEASDWRIELHSITGNIIAILPLNTQRVIWDCSDVTKGLYMYSLFKNEIPICNGKIVIQ